MKKKYFKVNKPQVDYFTLTMYGESQYGKALEEMGLSEDEATEAKIRYYIGHNWDNEDRGGIKGGWALQRGRDHYLITAEGDVAHDKFFSMTLKQAKATRIDLQITIPRRASNAVTRDLVDALRSGDWPYRKRNIMMYEGDEGEGNTCAIGSRSSYRYIRIYEKLGTDGLWYVRFEVEYKGELADDAYLKLSRGGEDMIAPMLLSEMDMLPDVSGLADFLALRAQLQKETRSLVARYLGNRASSENGDG